MKNKELLGNIILLITAIIWGTAFVAQRVGMDDIEPLTFNAVRMWLAAAAVSGLSLVPWKLDPGNTSELRADQKKAYNRNTIIGGICCGFFLCFGSILQQMGLVYTTAGKAGFITAMYILLVPVISSVFFKKKNSWIVWLAVAMGIVGLYLLCITDSLKLTHGDLLICISALFFTGHILSCDYFSKTGNPIRISAIQFTTVAAISSVAALITEKPGIEKIILALFPIVYCGLISGGLGYTMQLVGQKYTKPTSAALIMSLEAVFAVISGSILLHERMTQRELAGCIIMFAAIIIVQLPVPDNLSKNN